jgi:hypothetical protein
MKAISEIQNKLSYDSSDYRRSLDWWPDLLHTLIQRVTAIYSSLVSAVTSSLLLLGSGFQRRKFPFLWVPELSPTSATGFSKQQLTKLRLSNSTHSPTDRLVLLITSRHRPHIKHCFSLAVHGPLPRNGRCIVDYFAVVAWQWVYLP